MWPIWLQIVTALFAMSLLMSGLWLHQRWTGKAGVVDVAWGLGVALSTAMFAFFANAGLLERRLLIVLLASVWALRLSGYVLIRVWTMPEDGRYETLKERWGQNWQATMFGFFQLQALWSVLFALPMLIALHNPHRLGVWDVIGLLVGASALAGEAIADRQLHRFRSRSDTSGQVCQAGLWRYSRHPNYFFEWLHWWAYVALSVGAPWWWLTFLGPAVMLYFLLYVTGIPPAEEQALKSRGEAYRTYQQTTSVFIPWPPKQEAVT